MQKIAVVNGGKSVLAKVLAALAFTGVSTMEAFGRLATPSTISLPAYNSPHRTVGGAQSALLDRGERFRSRPGFIKGIESKFNSRWV